MEATAHAPCRAATLVALPSYPNSVAWSEENLVAIPTEHLITILNPASLTSARGLITLKQNKPFPVGLIERKDLLSPCLQPTCLSRDARPCARSISWSPLGIAPNSGCLLAVCTTDGYVTLYRAPISEYCSEWIKVVDISDLLCDHLNSIHYGALHEIYPVESRPNGIKWGGCNVALENSVCKRFSSRRKRKIITNSIEDSSIDPVRETSVKTSKTNIVNQQTYCGWNGNNSTLCSTDMDNGFTSDYSYRTNKVLSSDLPHLTAEQYASRSVALSSVVVTWSPLLLSSEICCAILAIGAKSGAISFWRIPEPPCYTIELGNASVKAILLGIVQAHKSWITAICFAISAASFSDDQLVLATGSCDGSVKIWSGNVGRLLQHAEVDNNCFSLIAEVTTSTTSPVSTIALVIQEKTPDNVVLAVGRGSGLLEIWTYVATSKKLESAGYYNAHEQVVTGLAWAVDGCFLYSCSQDNSIRGWILHGNALYEASLPSKFPYVR
ncbi:hypothetical protein HPP92_020923 [Vanilla planifolia]|uniref:Transcription factor IIIC 90kDa subunit N-terminal domain-containing protein n=1 Tax=Vanilla planifolia TaxID=51239 RepID=A0A835Q6Y5_VANPL|nr:hypothetical protein HPP92_020923 [Vanilla planifolia]